MRLLILKHARDGSFAALEREVRAHVVHGRFTRIGWEAVPDARTLARIARALGPEGIEQPHERLIEMAREKRVVRGRKLRIDTTVAETSVRSEQGGEQRRELCGKLLEIGGRVAAQARRKSTPRGLPVQSFQDWLKDLAAITKNRMEAADKTIPSFEMTTRPPRTRALELLQVKL